MIKATPDAQAIKQVVKADKEQSYWHAAEIRGLAKFAEYRPPGRPGIKVADGAAEELAAVLHLSIFVARARILEAEYMVRRLPATVDALEEGKIDMPRARATVQITKSLSDEDAREVENAVLANGRHASYKEYRRALRRQVMKVAPDVAERQRLDRKENRNVVKRKKDNGTANLVATLPAPQATAAYSILNYLAHKAKTPEDTRTLAQRRADVLVDLLLGKKMGRAQVRVNVTVPLTTLIGLNKQPGELAEYGPITAEQCRELANSGALRRIVTDDFGHLLEVGRNYYASAGLEEHIRMRDRICRQPGCSVPAERCQVVPIRPDRAGATDECDHHLRCKAHRLMPQRVHGWLVTQPEPGHIVFVTPTGQVRHMTADPYEEPAA